MKWVKVTTLQQPEQTWQLELINTYTNTWLHQYKMPYTNINLKDWGATFPTRTGFYSGDQEFMKQGLKFCSASKLRSPFACAFMRSSLLIVYGFFLLSRRSYAPCATRNKRWVIEQSTASSFLVTGPNISRKQQVSIFRHVVYWQNPLSIQWHYTIHKCSGVSLVPQVHQMCESCGVCMGKYFCGICKFYDDDVTPLILWRNPYLVCQSI